ncbi:hypothetical protein HYH02_001427 [Chlamydomonas schloesseri]|uniref:Small ribosomal subunit protein uS15c n=1 Tax=Chlamydomonas schloesseri TaxID=2026947 RepID=A0A835WVC1_9CHLO|nr:hypothetical protein HYH02_001427 [Chlamydomonas schloesseri]|eukprot:KAG2454405.1 hypothetical protein HYH02_001427 [Chlamydomonas schloesseri]
MAGRLVLTRLGFDLAVSAAVGTARQQPCLASSAATLHSALPAALHPWLHAGHPPCGALSLSTSSSSGAAADAEGGTSSSSPAPQAVAAAGSGSTGVAGPSGEPKPDLVEKLLSNDVLSKGERRRYERQALIREFQRHPADTGSPQVMVAVWTHRVRELVKHFDANRKELRPMRELEMMVNQRRRMLTWLRRADFESYAYVIAKLGLQDIYTPVGIADRYREGLRPSDPVQDDSVNRLRFSFHTQYKQKKANLWQRLRPQLLAEDPVLAAQAAAEAAAEKQRQTQQRNATSQQLPA